MTAADTAPSLSEVADRLTRAADRIEQLLADYRVEQIPDRWEANDNVVRCVGGPDDLVETWTWREAALIAAFDPHTVAALIPLLLSARNAALIMDTGAEPGITARHEVSLLDVFARRLLGEEESDA